MSISNYLGVSPAPPTIETNRYWDIDQQSKVKNNSLRTQDVDTKNNGSTDFNSLLRKTNEKLNNQSLKLPSADKTNLNKSYQDLSRQTTKVKNDSLSRLHDINTRNNSLTFNSLLGKSEKLNNQSSQLSEINKQKAPNSDENGTNIALKELAQELGNEFWVTLWQVMLSTEGVEGYTDSPGVQMFQPELVRAMVTENENNGEMGDIARSIYEQVKVQE